MLLNRRALLAGLVSLPATTSLLSKTLAEEPFLGNLARQKGLTFGAAVHSSYLANDHDYRSLVSSHCSALVPEWEMKWHAIEAIRDRRDYSRTEAILNFAQSHGMTMRGHTAVWHRALPDWAPSALLHDDGDDIMQAHVSGVVGRYGRQLDSFDVVNEAIDSKDGNPHGFRNSPYYSAFGADYVRQAFELAHEAAPDLKLFYNDLELDYDDPNSDNQRRCVLRLLERLKRSDVPIHGLGIQGHLRLGRNYSAEKHRRFLAEVSAIGLEIAITEFDVNDSVLPSDIARRDAEISTHARAYLETALDERAVVSLLTWGVTSKYSWLNESARYLRNDGHPTRGLPFDENYNKTALFDTIASVLATAPSR